MKQKTATKKTMAKASRKVSPSTSGTKGTATSAVAGQTRNKSASNGKDEEANGSLLEKLFFNMLKDMLWAEKQLVKALSKMQTSATTEELQDAFEDHLYITQKHVSRLERTFKYLGKEPEERKCDAMAGLIAESETMIQETKENSMTRDAALIIAAQKIEHYEIATYGSLVQLAITLRYYEVAELLEKTLWEEETTDYLLTDIAESYVNPLSDQEGKRDDHRRENVYEEIVELSL
jgi:ferritin-like metal-binding protein YciE